MPDAASPSAPDIPRGMRRRARRLAWAYLIVAVGLIVWTVFLALSLPKENLEQHYRLTWAGFDLIEVLAIYLTAHMAFRLGAERAAVSYRG
jgi:nitrate/nitrite transporter NarK